MFKKLVIVTFKILLTIFLMIVAAIMLWPIAVFLIIILPIYIPLCIYWSIQGFNPRGTGPVWSR